MKIVATAGSQIPSDTANSIQVMKACNALARLGHELTLIVPEVNVERSALNVQRHYGIETSFPIEWLASPSRRLFTWQSVQRARALRADLLYTWFPQSAVFGLLHRIPTVFEIHLQPTGAFGPAWHRAFALLRGRKRLASITQALVDVLERRHNIRFKADEVVIAPNGVELERFASLLDPVTARQTLSLPSAPTVMCTGHLYAGRGADLFLALAKELPQAHFVWVGGRTDDIAAWKSRAQSGNVTFTGFIPNSDLPLYQSAADVLLMPYSRSIMGSSGSGDSASVASPMKMFEYMAAGRAIVTADLPVIREVLNERNAVFCEPGISKGGRVAERSDAYRDHSHWELVIQDWKSKIEKLLADEPLRLSLGEQAREDVQGYTWSSRAEKIMRGL